MRKLLFDVTKPIEEKGGVVAIDALRTGTYDNRKFDFDVSRYLAIVEEIAMELRRENFRSVELSKSKESLKYFEYPVYSHGERVPAWKYKQTKPWRT